MGESQGAEDDVRGEGGEEADQDQAGQQDEGGGEHGGLEQRLNKLEHSDSNRGGEEGESKCSKIDLQTTTMTFVKEGGDSATD